MHSPTGTSHSDPAKPVALVTGASSGIGYAAANLFARRGWRVFGASRRGQEASGNVPTGVEQIKLDVRSDDEVDAVVRDILSRAERIDVLVNNAGYALLGGLEESSTAQAKALFETNFFGAMRMANAVLPSMRERGTGRIVNVSSVVGFIPAPYMGLYAASKHALEGWAESLDHEVRPFGIRVLLIEPGFTRTNIGQATAAADTPLPAYDAQRRHFQDVLQRELGKAPEPGRVATAIFDAATSNRPHLRYPVGRDAALLSRLRRLVPAAMFDRGIRKQFELDVAA
jgi:NAD(P)-dependent dehydrogenase (short-subunit alcohol dehydrogenase family)